MSGCLITADVWDDHKKKEGKGNHYVVWDTERW